MKKWDLRTIQRSSQTAEAQLERAQKSGFDLYEANAKHYKLRRPWSAAARPDEVEEHPEETEQ